MFNINLICSDDINTFQRACGERDYDPDFDTILSLIDDMCNAISICDSVRFEVSGFGQDVWPVDVAVELCLVVEQLPELLQWLDTPSGEIGQLDFFEQGVERLLTFRSAGADIVISCTSRMLWQPSPPEETIPRIQLEHMLVKLLTTFMALTRHLCPQIYNHSWFVQWRQQDVIRRRLSDIDV